MERECGVDCAIFVSLCVSALIDARAMMLPGCQRRGIQTVVSSQWSVVSGL